MNVPNVNCTLESVRCCFEQCKTSGDHPQHRAPCRSLDRIWCHPNTGAQQIGKFVWVCLLTKGSQCWRSCRNRHWPDFISSHHSQIHSCYLIVGEWKLPRKNPAHTVRRYMNPLQLLWEFKHLQKKEDSFHWLIKTQVLFLWLEHVKHK